MLVTGDMDTTCFPRSQSLLFTNVAVLFCITYFCYANLQSGHINANLHHKRIEQRRFLARVAAR